MCIVVNKYKSEYDVYIGRGSIWGNPFPINLIYNREKAIQHYKTYLWDQIRSGEITKQMLLELKGKRLGCFCKPQACHGDVIVAAVKWAEKQ